VRLLAAEDIFSVNCICLQNKRTTTPTALRQHDDVTKSGHNVLMQKERFICCSCRRPGHQIFSSVSHKLLQNISRARHLT